MFYRGCTLIHFRSLSIALLLVPILAGGLFAQDSTLLPLKKVVLYSSGVGYFQHEGTVQGMVTFPLSFPQKHMNDLLKSLVVQDFNGGHVPSVTYSSHDPVERVLSQFPIDLSKHPKLAQLLSQIRGEPVECTTSTVITGILVGVEEKQEVLDSSVPPRTVTSEHLTILTKDGLRSLPFTQIQQIRLLNKNLHQQLRQALSLLASTHKRDRKTLSISFSGTGTRQARVAYLTETPVWKSAYRLVLDKARKPYLQGWAIVENTSERDWSQIQLSFVSGHPLSFRMNLYQPHYVPRPMVTPEYAPSIAPQRYEGGVEQSMTQQKPRRGKMLKDQRREAGNRPLAEEPESMVGDAAALEESRPLDLRQGIHIQAQGDISGNLFSYTLSHPVTILRHTSAMVPIVGQEVTGEKVSIYNAQVHARHPLHGFRIKNTSPLHLMQGPITIFEDGAYAGDAQIEDLPSQESRLISYAIDGQIEVIPTTQAHPQEFVTVAIRKGTLQSTKRLNHEFSYLIHNRDQKGRSLLLEHPFRNGWTVDASVAPEEKTRTGYRFPVIIEPGSAQTFTIRETKPIQETVHLLNSRLDRIEWFLKRPTLSPAVKKALERIVTLRTDLEETQRSKTRVEQRIKDIADEQSRIRNNMQRLRHSSPLYQRYVKKLDQQETELEDLRKNLDRFLSEEEEKRKTLEEYLLNVNIA